MFFWRKANNPKIGPIARQEKIKLLLVNNCNELTNWMLTIVMANPILFTKVSAVPFTSAGAFWATSVESKGESATTAMPQNSRKVINSVAEGWLNSNGEIRQQIQDNNKAMVAIFLVPKFSDK